VSPLFYGIVCIGVVVAIFLVWLIVNWAVHRIARWRESRAIRVKNEDLNRYNMAAFRGTKERRL
jgi:hypothetical protein